MFQKKLIWGIKLQLKVIVSQHYYLVIVSKPGLYGTAEKSSSGRLSYVC